MKSLGKLLLSPAALHVVRVDIGPSNVRGLFAIGAMSAGSVVLQDPPLAFAPRDELSVVEARVGLTCDGRNLSRLAVRLAERIAGEAAAGASPTWDVVRVLARARLPERDATREALLERVHAAVPASAAVVTVGRWRELMGVVALNAVRLQHGSALFGGASLLNHSCCANVDYAESGFVFRTNRPVAAGEELNISYTDASAPTPARRAWLFNNYGFTCRCPRCQGEADGAAPQPM